MPTKSKVYDVNHCVVCDSLSAVNIEEIFKFYCYPVMHSL